MGLGRSCYCCLRRTDDVDRRSWAAVEGRRRAGEEGGEAMGWERYSDWGLHSEQRGWLEVAV